MPPTTSIKMSPFLRTSLLVLHRPQPISITSPPRLNSILRLPPSLRTHTRSFHASPRPQYLDTALLSTQACLDSIHTVTGLPWAYTLPLSALLIRLTIVLPISLYHRSLMQKQINLFPLLSGWRHLLQKQTMAEVGHRGPKVATNVLLRKVRSKRVEIYKRWGVQSWKTMSLPFLQLPIFLIVIETIRKMAGREEGLAGMLWGRLFTSTKSVEETTTAAGTALSEILPQTAHLEPTLATEGALWFPDLLVPDPQLILPFLLSSAILLNIFGRLPSAGAPAVEKLWQKRLKRIFGTLALAVGPMTMNVPSAMLVYWISSTTLAYVQAVMLEVWRPLKKAAGPCEPKRPLRNALDVGRKKVGGEEA